MRRIIPIIAVLATTTAVPGAGQTEAGHVFRVITYRAHTDQAGAYSQAYRTDADPVYAELVRRGWIVSYRLLVKDAGSGDSTHMIILEFPNWEAVGQFPENIDQASQAALGRPWSTVLELVTPMRELISSDLYEGPPAS